MKLNLVEFKKANNIKNEILNQTPISILENEMGVFISGSQFQIIFGSAKLTRDNIQNIAPIKIDLFAVKQAHGDNLVATLDIKKQLNLIEADALYSQFKNEMLLIKTADCNPIMVVDKEGRFALAIHAGWRGFVNLIVIKSISRLLTQLSLNSESLLVFVGPRILQESFEIDLDVKNLLEKSIFPNFEIEKIGAKINSKIKYDKNKLSYSKLVNNIEKYYFNLDYLLELQLATIGVTKEQIKFIEIDTVKNNKWNSYRRDKSNSGRNLSAIVLT